jgi:hypothetical protein
LKIRDIGPANHTGNVSDLTLQKLS